MKKRKVYTQRERDEIISRGYSERNFTRVDGGYVFEYLRPEGTPRPSPRPLVDISVDHWTNRKT